MIKNLPKILLCTALAGISFATFNLENFQKNNTSQPENSNLSKVTTAVGDPTVLEKQYNEWKQINGFDKDIENAFNALTITMVNAKSHLATAKGFVNIDIHTGKLESKIKPESSAETLELWATQDANLYPKTEIQKNLTYIGTFTKNNNNYQLQTDLTQLIDSGFQIGQLVVVPESAEHLESMVLAGSPSLFQRLLITEKVNSLSLDSNNSVINALVPMAQATEDTGFPEVFDDLVTEGEDVFFNRTFEGNGRTCGTCHPATNNFTIDPAYIALLPDDDPLFVAEYIPELIYGDQANLDINGNPQRFENPALMRKFALIVENVDGLEDLDSIFTMRSVTHNIGMTVSVETPPQDITPPDDRTGWSGDGAPSGIIGGIAASGRVRDFLLGAIVQHYPKTMARSFTSEKPDFRPPTIRELDAMEAFLFSVGRKTELELTEGADNELKLRDASAEAGKELFRDGTNGSFSCNNCHGGAGANVLFGDNPGNRNFNTGIEAFLHNRIEDSNLTVIGEPRPVDGGFGTNPEGTFDSLVEQPSYVNENFGNQQFNTVSVVEAADTAPFFHNNVAVTLEQSIRFYNTPEFIEATNGLSIPFNDEEVVKVANFMRVINAIDNIENLVLPQSDRLLKAIAQEELSEPVIDRIADIMIADSFDAIEVLLDGDLHSSGLFDTNASLRIYDAILALALAKSEKTAPILRFGEVLFAQSELKAALKIIRE